VRRVWLRVRRLAERVDDRRADAVRWFRVERVALLVPLRDFQVWTAAALS
jgi:hypothetical protein